MKLAGFVGQLMSQHAPHLGDYTARAIDAATLGLAKPCAQAVARAAGLPDCGCAERQAALNRWGESTAKRVA